MREDAQEDKTADAGPRNPLMQTYVDEQGLQDETSGNGDTAAGLETDAGGGCTGSTGMPQVA